MYIDSLDKLFSYSVCVTVVADVVIGRGELQAINQIK